MRACPERTLPLPGALDRAATRCGWTRYRSAHPHVQGVVETAYAIDGWRRRASGVIVLGYLAALRAWDAPGDGVTLSALRAPLADWASGAEHNTVIKRPHHCGGLRAG